MNRETRVASSGLLGASHEEATAEGEIAEKDTWEAIDEGIYATACSCPRLW